MPRWTWREFGITQVFRVPLALAYAWCTDCTPEDGRYGGENRSVHVRRKIVERTKRLVVFENLYDEGKGWAGNATWSP